MEGIGSKRKISKAEALGHIRDQDNIKNAAKQIVEHLMPDNHEFCAENAEEMKRINTAISNICAKLTRLKQNLKKEKKSYADKIGDEKWDTTFDHAIHW